MTVRNKILFTIMVLLWGSNWSTMKIGLEIAPVFTFNYQRFVLSSITILILCIVFKVKLPKDWDAYKRVLIYSVISTVGFTFTSFGLIAQTSGISSVLTYTQPIWVFILAVPFLRESFSVRKMLGIVLGFSGVTVLFLKDVGLIMSFSAFALVVGAFLWAVTNVYYKLKLENVDPYFINFANAVLAAVVLFVLSFLIDPKFQSWSTEYLWVLVYSGIGASGVGMTIWLLLLKNEDATSLSSASLIVPIIALFFGWLAISEGFGIESIFGSALVLIGIYLVNHSKRKAQ